MAVDGAGRGPIAPGPGGARFRTTRWSLVRAAGAGPSAEAREAMASLCEAYWYPLYAFVRRKGYDAESAQDLVQGFFARLLDRNDLAAVGPDKGRFRSFLMACCAHFLANQAARARALRRGGGRPNVSIDGDDAERRYRLEPSHGATAERLFERRWALTLLDRVLQRLREEHEGRGKAEQFEALKPALLGSADRLPYDEVARGLGISEEAARAAASRLRRRYRELLRAEVAQTVDGEAEVDDEIRALFAALSAV